MSEIQNVINLNGTDSFLQELVRDVNNPTYELAVDLTLTIGSMLVTGTLISGKEYFNIFATQFASTYPVEKSKDALYKHFSQKGEIYNDVPKDEKEAEIHRQQTFFIHMKNVYFFNAAGNRIPYSLEEQGALWRGKISSVDGFFLGRLVTNK